jgi:hypothetical protein
MSSPYYMPIGNGFIYTNTGNMIIIPNHIESIDPIDHNKENKKDNGEEKNKEKNKENNDNSKSPNI